MGVWVNDGSQWYDGTGATPIGSRDDLVSGVDIPTLENTGVLSGVSRSNYSSAGIINIDAGASFENQNFLHPVNIRTADPVTFTNCLFAPPGDYDDSLAFCTHSAVADVTFTDCTFQPTWGAHADNDTSEGHGEVPAGIKGHHFTAHRCQFLDLDDGIQVFNTNSPGGTVDVDIQQCYFGDFAFWRPDPLGRPEGTHNDGIQVADGGTILIRGNYFSGFNNPAIGDAQFSEYSAGGDLHGLPADYDPEQWINGACVFAKEDVGNITGLVIDKNWLFGGQVQINISSTGTISGVTITDNICGNGGTVDAGRYDTNIWVGASSYAAATDISGNLQEDSSAIDLVQT